MKAVGREWKQGVRDFIFFPLLLLSPTCTGAAIDFDSATGGQIGEGDIVLNQSWR